MKGTLPSRAHVDEASLRFLNWLSARHPGGIGSRSEAYAQIHQDMLRTWLALSYGGRLQKQIPSERQESLRREALEFGWAHR